MLPFGPFLRDVEGKRPFTGWKRLLAQTLPLTFFFHWLWSLAPYGGLLYYLILVPLAFHRFLRGAPPIARGERAFLLLWHFVAIIGGFGALRGFIGHFFLADMVASRIGWQTGSPFQTELAFFQLGISAASLLALWFRRNLVEGLALTLGIFGWGAAYVHLQDWIVHGNDAPYNTGAVLVGDLLIPLLLFVLLAVRFRDRGET